MREFVKNNLLNMIICISMLFILFFNSIIALTIYLIIIHVTIILLIVGLYYPEFILREDVTYKRILRIIAVMTPILVILAVRERWYTLIISSTCAGLAIVCTHHQIKTKGVMHGKQDT